MKATSKRLIFRSVIVPALIGLVFAGGLLLAAPHLGLGVAFAAWIGTFFVYSVWFGVLNSFND